MGNIDQRLDPFKFLLNFQSEIRNQEDASLQSLFKY
jgi:hypothetical protein